ncbi:peroxiredoxin [Pseudonocardia acaciae]|uniref:peroxiredoxin n=1 Tax=Pseudonocardia acaciae TaxID=551276 RepID=UPI00048E3D37|nr:peroxiredoxin [Pseudonocardia acaciae]
MDIGDQVGDFELLDQAGAPRRLSTLLANGPVVLFFYPAASSAVCTKEACHFRDLGAEFAEVGAQPVGISPDAVGKQERFAAEHSFGFPLLSDTDGTVAKEFGVWRRLVPIHTKRATFVIGQDSRVLAVVRSELGAERHADDALRALKDRGSRPVSG